MSTPSTEQQFEEKYPLQNASLVALQSGALGFIISGLQNVFTTHSSGARGIITRTGGTIGFFAAMGATFAFTDAFVANQRRKDDHLNGVAGGCAAGFLAGIRAHSLPMAVGSCAVIGALMGTYDYAGKLTGDQEETKAERRRKFFKHPPPPLPGTLTE